MTTPATPAPGWYADPEHPGSQRYWDGNAWTQHRAPAAAPAIVVQAVPGNPAAVAALVLGICGFLAMGIPFFIGWFIGGPLDILAVVFGIVGIARAQAVRVGLAPAIVGLVLAAVSLLTVPFGAGTIW